MSFSAMPACFRPSTTAVMARLLAVSASRAVLASVWTPLVTRARSGAAVVSPVPDRVMVRRNVSWAMAGAARPAARTTAMARRRADDTMGNSLCEAGGKGLWRVVQVCYSSGCPAGSISARGDLPMGACSSTG
jgi:hypothetical protein